jgi:hypothetical protein
MARALTPQDCYALINAISAEITGQQPTLQAVDTSSFVSVGETILKAGTENTLNAIAIVLGRTFMAVRPYEAKLKILNTLNSDLYSNRIRKISFMSRWAEPSGAFNTNLYTNHAMDYDNGNNSGNSLPTMWEQNQPVPFELNFAGSSVWDDSTTIYEKQLQVAFRDESEFAAFMGAVMTEKGNDIETQKEAFNRAALLNHIGACYDMTLGGAATMAIDLVAAFNSEFGTSYTRTDCLTSHFKEFLEFMIGFLKKLSNNFTHKSTAYHWTPSKTINGVTYKLLRQTPKSKQKLIMYRPFWIDAEARVLPEIFNDQYLKPENYEGVDFWQNELNPSAVSVTPAVVNTADPTSQIAGTAVSLEYVVGLLFDEDALMIDYQFDGSYATPLEARKMYRNLWYHFRKNICADLSEKAVLLYLGEGGE